MMLLRLFFFSIPLFLLGNHSFSMESNNSKKQSKNIERPFKCNEPNCKSAFTKEIYLTRHKIIHSNERPFKCNKPNCNSTFKRKTDLNKHKQVHSKERPFKCNEPNCKSAFKRKSDLTHHKKSHSIEKTFKCNESNCSAKFKTNGELNKHKAHHSDERPFKCNEPDCNAKFKLKGDLTKHKKKHSDEKPFKCTKQNCNARFKLKDGLNKHQITHSKKKTFKCDYKNCKSAFKRKGDLTRHKKMHQRTKLSQAISDTSVPSEITPINVPDLESINQELPTEYTYNNQNLENIKSLLELGANPTYNNQDKFQDHEKEDQSEKEEQESEDTQVGIDLGYDHEEFNSSQSCSSESFNLNVENITFGNYQVPIHQTDEEFQKWRDEKERKLLGDTMQKTEEFESLKESFIEQETEEVPTHIDAIQKPNYRKPQQPCPPKPQLKPAPNINERLYSASSQKNLQSETIKKLIELKANPNYFRDQNARETVFHILCDNRKTPQELIEYLIEHGAKFHSRDNNQETVLHRICDNRSVSLELIRFLLTKTNKKDWNTKDKDGDRPLHRFFVSAFGNPYKILEKTTIPHKKQSEQQKKEITDYSHAFEVLKILLTRANPNAKNNTGETILHWVCMNENPNIELITLLVKNGADWTVKNNKKQTPKDYLKKYCLNKELYVKILKK